MNIDQQMRQDVIKRQYRLDEKRLVVALVIWLYNDHSLKTPAFLDTQRLNSHLDTHLLLQHGTTQLFWLTGLSQGSFRQLASYLGNRDLVKSSARVTHKEKLLIFLYISRHALTQRPVTCMFKWGLEVVSKAFNEVLLGLVQLFRHIVTVPEPDAPVPEEIADNARFHYFEDCIGALDGSHIPAWIRLDQQPAFRNRKQTISQNVLFVCGFDMRFHYVLAGWEGSAHDCRVLHAAIRPESAVGALVIPPGKYYLADAGYYCTEYMMTPYRGVRYHLRERALAQQKPRNKEELFNNRHASLRNVIERILGVIKRKYKITRLAPEYPFATQVKIVLALAAVHNYTYFGDDTDLGPDQYEHDPEEAAVDEDDIRLRPPPPGSGEATRRRVAMEQLRHEISERMWSESSDNPINN